MILEDGYVVGEVVVLVVMGKCVIVVCVVVSGGEEGYGGILGVVLYDCDLFCVKVFVDY